MRFSLRDPENGKGILAYAATDYVKGWGVRKMSISFRLFAEFYSAFRSSGNHNDLLIVLDTTNTENRKRPELFHDRASLLEVA